MTTFSRHCNTVQMFLESISQNQVKLQTRPFWLTCYSQVTGARIRLVYRYQSPYDEHHSAFYFLFFLLQTIKNGGGTMIDTIKDKPDNKSRVISRFTRDNFEGKIRMRHITRSVTAHT